MRGRDKLLEDVDGEALLRRQARRACATGYPVLATLPPDRPDRAAALKGLDIQPVTVADAASGMAASLRAGIAALPAEATAVMILLADLPDLDTPDLLKVADCHAAHPDRVIQATSEQGKPGHPVILPRRLFAALGALVGDQGAKPVLASEMALFCPLQGNRALTDLDTPEAWAAWRAARQ